jgi:hypothetical protein
MNLADYCIDFKFMRFPTPFQLGANSETDETFARFRGKNQVNVPSVPGFFPIVGRSANDH